MGLGWWFGIAGAVAWVSVRWLRRPVNLPPGDDDGTLAGLVQAGQRIEAIRRYRARQGGGLKDAREAVEALARGASLEPRPVLTGPEPSTEVVALVRAGRQLEAIKAYRETHPALDLATAKQILDALRTRLGS